MANDDLPNPQPADDVGSSRTRIIVAAVVLVVVCIATMATLAARAHAAAPAVIEEIASERQAAFEKRISTRITEAQAIVVEMFGFLRDVWQNNASLAQIRTDLDRATTQMRRLTEEVGAAVASPVRGGAVLIENGPTRAAAILDAAVAVAEELQRLVPLVLGSIDRATKATAAADGAAGVEPILASLDGLLAPFIGENEKLANRWQAVRTEAVDWASRLADDVQTARNDLAGEALSAEFMRRIAQRVF